MRLIDGLGRVHDDLRISVTDRCNLRCSYCMPEQPIWFSRDKLLTFEELNRLVGLAVSAGVRKLRLTGGEPLLRRDLAGLVAMLRSHVGIEDLSLTTNGLLLDRQAAALAKAGLRRINVSLDSLIPQRYAELTRRDGLERALAGIRAAAEAGLTPIKVNAVILRGVNDDEVESLVQRAREQGWELRFIEFMPLENGDVWRHDEVVRGDELRARIDRRWPIEPAIIDPAAPATRYRFRDGAGYLGFIDSVTQPFCASCTRLRLTSDGQWRVCLYDDRETDLKALLRSGADDAALLQAMLDGVRAKGRGGALDILESRQPLSRVRTMHQIGG